MHLYSVYRQLNPALARHGVAVALEAGTRAAAISGLDISVWTTTMSPNVGVISWTALVETLTDLETGMDKLGADGGFNDYVEQNDSVFSGPLGSTLAHLVSAAPDPAAGPPAYAAVVRATCVSGQAGAGMAGGVEIAEAATRIGGLTTSFFADVTGEYGGVAWITTAPDLATLEASNELVNADAGFSAMVDRIASAYLPHAASTMYRRLSS